MSKNETATQPNEYGCIVTTPIQFVVSKDRPAHPTLPGHGRGRSPLTDALLLTASTGGSVAITVGTRSPRSLARRLHMNLRKYGHFLRYTLSPDGQTLTGWTVTKPGVPTRNPVDPPESFTQNGLTDNL